MDLSVHVRSAVQKAMEGNALRTTERLSVYDVNVDPIRAFYLVVMNDDQELELDEAQGLIVREVISGKTCFLVPKETALHL